MTRFCHEHLRKHSWFNWLRNNLLTGILISLRCTGSSKHPSNQMIGLERFMTGTILNQARRVGGGGGGGGGVRGVRTNPLKFLKSAFLGN